MKNLVALMAYCVLGWVLLLPCNAFGQKNHYRLDGKVVVDGGDTYQYQLDFTEKRGAIYGYSLTWLSENYPSKARVTGTIDKINRTITFSEKEEKSMLFLKSTDMCYFNGTLAYTQTGDLFLLSGKFTGLNSYSQYCGQGEITLSQNTRGDSLLGVIIKPKQQPIPITPVAETKEEPAKDAEVITAERNKEITWYSDTCLIDIWDYGTVDGDIISVVCNGKSILDNYEITAVKKHLKIPLRKGDNRIKIVAENEGKAPPNTARLLLTDNKRQYSFTAYNTEGNNATIVLRRAE